MVFNVNAKTTGLHMTYEWKYLNILFYHTYTKIFIHIICLGYVREITWISFDQQFIGRHMGDIITHCICIHCENTAYNNY